MTTNDFSFFVRSRTTAVFGKITIFQNRVEDDEYERILSALLLAMGKQLLFIR